MMGKKTEIQIKDEVSQKLEIDVETADRITVLSLKQYQSFLMEEIEKFEDGEYYLHPIDVALNIKTIKAIELIVKQFERPQ